MFVVYGVRPGGALLGKPGARIGAFAVSGVLHDVGLWGLGRGMELAHRYHYCPFERVAITTTVI